jgi:hypothetical protein
MAMAVNPLVPRPGISMDSSLGRFEVRSIKCLLTVGKRVKVCPVQRRDSGAAAPVVTSPYRWSKISYFWEEAQAGIGF